MATYYACSNNQRDGAPMAYIPGSYPEAQILPGNVIMYMNNGSFSDNLGQNSQQQSNCIEIHSIGTSDSTPQQHEILPNLNTWRDNFAMHSVAGPSSILNNGQNLQGQGLSLSLGMQIPSAIHVPYRNPNSGLDSFSSPSLSMMGEEGGRNGEEQSKNAEFFPPDFSGGNQDLNKVDFSSYGMTSVARTVPSSKYLKTAQQLLDEVVNVKKALKQPDNKINQPTEEHNNSKEDENQSKNVSSDPQDNLSKELSNGERQELQNKLTKLLSMLDEVDRRYKQYYHQMQIVVSSFDAVAGSGAAKPYTALALQTISRHFRCLRDAISGQIQATRKSLGEPESSESSKGVGITRLRYVDQQLRQQRALQQLGMMQQHAWRPQRGLPESSVSILRAWLFEHFLHPYPKDSDKIMLARQTGLTRSQVSNWFVNARVRLWKPMVEEMYKEEIGDVDLDSISSSENAAKAMKRTSEDRGEELQQTSTSALTERHNTGPLMDSQTNHVHDLEIAGSATRSDFQNVDAASEYRFMATAAGAYHVPGVGGCGGRSGVSLTLGLQHCEGGNLQMSAVNNHGFMRGSDLYGASGSSETADFECLNPGNRQNRYSSSHMLHDFVA